MLKKSENVEKLKDKAMELLKDHLSKDGNSSYQVAKETKITEATIGNYKNGKTKPTEANAEILMRYFDKSQKNEIGKNNSSIAGSIFGIQGSGHTINNNPNDISNLIKMVESKDYIIAQLRKKIEEKHDDYVAKLDEMDKQCKEMLTQNDKQCKEMLTQKDKQCKEMLTQKDKFIEKLIADRDELIKKMMDREQTIVKNSYDRNNENLTRMDTMHEHLFELQKALLNCINVKNS